MSTGSDGQPRREWNMSPGSSPERATRRPQSDVEQARRQQAGQQDERSTGSQGGATSIRLKLGLEDVKTKRFLNHLTRFHYLKRRLDRKAKELLSLSFLNDARYAKKPAMLQQEGANDVEFQRAAARQAMEPLRELISRAVRAAGLEPESQPNLFMECGSGFYTAATLGPLKTEARCAEKAKDDYGGDVRRLIDIARASIVVDNEAQLRAVFDALISPNVVRLKNRFANPSFNGYRDALFNVRVDGHIAEVQVHLTPFLEQKGEAHKHYKFFRETFHGSEGTVN